jgi:hypothetical protein
MMRVSCDIPFTDKMICFILTILTICIIVAFEYFCTKKRHNNQHPIYIDEDGVAHTHISLSKLSPLAASKIYERDCIQNEICPITREVFVPGMRVAVMPCGHVYSQEALRTWFQIDRRACLICKRLGEPTYL